MAKYTPGPIVASVSGSMGGTTFSHNRGGPYFRNRSIPVTSQTVFALAARAGLATASSAWQGLTDGQRAAWLFWAVSNPVTDALGRTIQLTGQQGFVGNFIRQTLAGQTTLDDPPIVPAPLALTSMTITADIGLGGVEIVFAATPLGAAEYLWVLAAVTNSAGITYVQNLLRFTGVSSAAETTPFDMQTLVEDRIGTLVIGQKLTIFCRVFSSVSGMYSPPIRGSAIVEETS